MMQIISSQELRGLRVSEPNLRIIDLRTKGETAAGMIPGAEWMDMSSREFMKDVADLPKDKPYCLYCATGGRSSLAAQFMESMGFQKLYNLEGGYESYE